MAQSGILIKLFWLAQFVIFWSSVSSQDLKKLSEFSPGKIETVSVDRMGNFFVIFRNGSIKKYDPDNKVLAAFKKGEAPTLLQPWYHPKIFIYQKTGQKFTEYDRNFQNPEVHTVDPSVAIKPLLVCPTNDNKLLVLDEEDYSIKKLNPATNQVVTEFYVDSTEFKEKPRFTFLCDYQNLIFLLDRNSGILIFSNVGKKVNQIKCTTANFGFFGEELYFLDGDKITFYDLYTEKSRDLKSGAGKFVVVTDERIFLVTEKDRVVVFENPLANQTD